MSADALRRAAALMRERATSVTGGPWEAGDACVWAPTQSPNREDLIVGDGPDGGGGCVDPETADHIASWHPAVALAVADWLDGMALSMTHPSGGPSTDREEDAAFAVATAYLNESA